MKRLNKLITDLKRFKVTLALAESVSGGYAGYLLTKIPGASRVFKGGFIVYSLEAKNKLLGLPQKTLKKTQGVSKGIAITLAKRVRKKLKADLGASLVGFAGPGTKKGVKVGTVFMAVSNKSNTMVKQIILKGNRDQIRKKSARLLVELIYKTISCRDRACPVP